MPQWVATLLVAFVSVVINALLIAYYYGQLSQTVKNHEASFASNEREQENQWSHINDLRADMGKVKGKLGINGV